MRRLAPRFGALALAGVVAGLTPGCATFPPRSKAPSPDASVLLHVPVREFENDDCGPGSLSLVLNSLGDPISAEELATAVPRTPGGGVLSVDLLLAARRRGFSASLVRGNEEMVQREIGEGRPVILLLRLLNVPGRGRDIYHYVVVDGVDPRRNLLRFQFGDGKARWTTLEPLEGAWKGAGHALLTVRKPGDPTALEEAVELEHDGRLDEAAERYRSILESDARSVRAWINLGNVRRQQGRAAEAERAYRRALELAPENTDATNNLAWLLLENGSDLEEAEALARRAAARPGPDQPLIMDTLARILAARGRCEEAEATFREALNQAGLSSELRVDLERARQEIRRSCRPAP